jgi:hypothetical protein
MFWQFPAFCEQILWDTEYVVYTYLCTVHTAWFKIVGHLSEQECAVNIRIYSIKNKNAHCAKNPSMSR